MPAELPQVLPEPDRDDLRAHFLRDVSFYSDGAQDISEGGQPWIDASVLADQLVPAHVRIKQSGDNLVLTKATGDAAEAWAEASGLTGRQAAVGASGLVEIEASAGGTHLFEGDELKYTTANLRFEVAVEGVYADGELVAVRGIDTGPGTNLDPGTVLTWTSPRPGCGSTATVWEDSDGEGLSGGRLEETDDEVIDRVIEAKRNPPASGNDAHYQALVKATPGLAVQQAFTHPAILGPGTVAIVFTLSPSEPGGDRLPNAAQMAQAQAWLESQVPHDDQFFICDLLGNDVHLALEVAWQTGADGWADAVPWPPYYAGTAAITVDSVTSAVAFVLERASGSYSGVAQPQAGQTIGFFDEDERAFVPKRIASVTGTGPWTIAIEATNDVSDLTYVPTVGEKAMPWSESLELILPPLLAHFDTLGPGEQVNSFFDAGSRQRRTPQPPKSWPSSVGARVINGVQDLDAVADAELQEPTTPLVALTGQPGVESYLHQLGHVAVYALT